MIHELIALVVLRQVISLHMDTANHNQGTVELVALVVHHGVIQVSLSC